MTQRARETTPTSVVPAPMRRATAAEYVRSGAVKKSAAAGFGHAVYAVSANTLRVKVDTAKPKVAEKKILKSTAALTKVERAVARLADAA